MGWVRAAGKLQGERAAAGAAEGLPRHRSALVCSVMYAQWSIMLVETWLWLGIGLGLEIESELGFELGFELGLGLGLGLGSVRSWRQSWGAQAG